MSRARQGGLRPNRRHVQRGSDMISFVLDVAGKTQSSLPIPLHLSFRTDREDALFAAIQAAKRCHALVAQWIERPPPERKATSPILVEGTHETPSTIMHGFSLLFSLTPSRLVRFVHYEATPL